MRPPAAARLLAKWVTARGVGSSRMLRNGRTAAWRLRLRVDRAGNGDVEKICKKCEPSDRVGTFGIGPLGRRIGSTNGTNRWSSAGGLYWQPISFDETPKAMREARPKRSGPVFESAGRVREVGTVPEVVGRRREPTVDPDMGALS